MIDSETAAPDSLAQGRQIFEDEAAALVQVGRNLKESFSRSIEAMLACQGRIVLTGMGKHGIVARKIAATLASTGTPCFFMHPAEGSHGDLGMVEPQDVVIGVSNSGNTAEIVALLPFFKRNGNYLIAMTGNNSSDLARAANEVLDIAVEREVCPLNLAPTTSTTAAMAMGDALAVVLLRRRGFGSADFALRHPGGALGRKLLLTVGDVVKAQSNPVISQGASYAEAVAMITREKRGAVAVIDGAGALVGIITDGDVRRLLEAAAAERDVSVASIMQAHAADRMTLNPVSVSADALAAQALALMEDGPRKVFVLPVVDAEKKPVAMLHLHDLVAAGI